MREIFIWVCTEEQKSSVNAVTDEIFKDHKKHKKEKMVLLIHIKKNTKIKDHSL